MYYFETHYSVFCNNIVTIRNAVKWCLSLFVLLVCMRHLPEGGRSGESKHVAVYNKILLYKMCMSLFGPINSALLIGNTQLYDVSQECSLKTSALSTQHYTQSLLHSQADSPNLRLLARNSKVLCICMSVCVVFHLRRSGKTLWTDGYQTFHKGNRHL